MLDNIRHGLRLVRMLDYDRCMSLGPVRVDISATSACNYRCYFCRSHSYLRSDNVKAKHMDDAMLEKLLSDLKTLKVKNVLFAGNGEPLLNHSLHTMIERYGKDFNIEILTNGSSLATVDRQMFDNLKFLTVSLNSGNGKSHQVVHGYKGVNQFGIITREIERLLKFKVASKKIKLNYAVTVDNYGELEDFKYMAKDWGVSTAIRPMSIDFPEIEAKGVVYV